MAPAWCSGSGRLVEQLAAYQHAADFAGAGPDFIEFGIAPQTPGGVLVDVAIAAQYLYALACHPGGFFGAVQNDGGAIFAYFTRMPAAQLIEILAHGIEESATGLQSGVTIGHLALYELELDRKRVERGKRVTESEDQG